MALTQRQQRALDIIRARINPDEPGFRGSDHVERALRSEHLSNYLQSWVYELLEVVATGNETFSGQDDDLRVTAAYIYRARQHAKQGG
jgi:hypothetical protein